MKSVIAIALFGVFLLHVNRCCAVDEHSSDGASLIQGVRLNAEGWRSYDVFIDISESVDTPEEVESITSIVRLVFDADTARCLCVVRGTGDKLSLDAVEKTKPSAQIERWSATQVDGSSFRTRKFPGPVNHSVAGSFNEALAKSGVPYLNTIGVWDFDFRQGQSIRGQDEKLLARLMLAATKDGEMRLSPSKTFLSARTPLNDSAHANTLFRYEFDNASLMPTLRFVGFEFKQSNPPAILPHVRDKIEWEQKESVFVPKSLEVGRTVKRAMSDGSVQKFEHITTVKFHWLKINEQLDPKHFQQEDLTAEMIRALTDESQHSLTK